MATFLMAAFSYSVEFKTYSLIDGLPGVLISSDAEAIGVTWQEGRIWDKALIEFFYGFLKNTEGEFVVLDVGAQTGCFTLLSKYFPQSVWYAFEPIEEAANVLSTHLEANEIHNVAVYCNAVSDCSGIAFLKIPSHSHWGLATLGEFPTRFNGYSARAVDCIDLDSFAMLKKIERVDFIKIDTEGWEFRVLQGARKLILKHRPTILMEFNEQNMQQCNVHPSELLNLLGELNYTWRAVSSEDLLCIPLD